jgi:ribosome-associated translation inhibitor RaiA
MRLEIRHDGVAIDERTRDHIERRLGFALDRFSPRIDHVTVFLSDQNGPRGGKDERCRVMVNLPASGPVVVDATETELLSAIDRAAHRANHAVGSMLERRRSHRQPISASGQPT